MTQLSERPLHRIDDLPGYRRRILITPAARQVSAALEDDIHCMLVTLHHDGDRITGVVPEMERAPWTTCPGACEVLVRSFVGLPLAEARVPQLKRINCTHLYDLAVLAAAHAGDDTSFAYDVLVSDPIAGEQWVELRNEDKVLHCWHLRDGKIVAPAVIANLGLAQLRDWIATLEPAAAEAARVLQWASLVAHGRTMSMARQSDPLTMQPNCHTFQPEQAMVTRRVGRRIDFTHAVRAPLGHFDSGRFHDDPHRDEHPEPPTPA
jgi:hypothetical protein